MQIKNSTNTIAEEGGRRVLAMKKCFLYFKEGVSVLAEADLEKCALKAQMSWLIQG